jgi:hypothetical protein
LRLAAYVVTLERKYVTKFPGHEATIRQASRMSANHHGRAVFRAQAYERIQRVNDDSPLKILVQIIQSGSWG